MPVTIEDLDRRVTTLEKAQNDNTQTLRWVVAKVGRMAAVQDEHTLRFDQVDQRLDGVEQRLDRVEQRLDRVEQRLDKVEAKVDRLQEDLTSLRRDLPGIVAETMREVLREPRV